MTSVLHRRAALAAFTAAGAGLLLPKRAFASETTQYFYDSLGRVIRVQFDNGATVVYSYDAAGNRTQVARTSSPPSTAFTQTIAITGTSGVNLRTLANIAGYGGAQDANVTFTLASGVTLTGAPAGGQPGGRGIDSGDWPITQYYVALTLQISGTVNGGGGSGGAGNPGGSTGYAGGDGIYCRVPMSVTVNVGGIVRGGGGGGGGGRDSGPPLYNGGGGGGGGGRPNGFGGPGGTGNVNDGQDGASGTTGGAGAGGSGGGGAATAGGAGGSYASNGASGVSGGFAGGAAGYGVRKNGYTVTVTNNGTITGTVG